MVETAYSLFPTVNFSPTSFNRREQSLFKRDKRSLFFTRLANGCGKRKSGEGDYTIIHTYIRIYKLLFIALFFLKKY